MISKDYLSRYGILLKNYEDKKYDYLTLKSEYECIGYGTMTDDVKVMSSSNPDKFTNLLVKVMKAERDLKLAEEKLLDFRKTAICRINSLSKPEYKQVLKLKYLELVRLEVIAKRLNVSTQWVCKLHKKALNEFDKRYYTQYNIK